jgi:toxin-antitoxin system PIN domain toxin
VLLPDVNVLVAAHRAAAPRHEEARAWLVAALGGAEAVALCLPVVSGLIRVGTSHRVFAPPSTYDQVFAFIRHLAAHPHTIWVNPGRQHLGLLEGLCRAADARGDLVSDALIAALAIEAGATVVTYDRDFARFRDVRWCTPGESA